MTITVVGATRASGTAVATIATSRNSSDPAKTTELNTVGTVEEFEAAVVAFDEVVAVRRLFGTPDYFVHVAVADADAFEAFRMSKLIGLPAVARATSHQIMKRLKG